MTTYEIPDFAVARPRGQAPIAPFKSLNETREIARAIASSSELVAIDSARIKSLAGSYLSDPSDSSNSLDPAHWYLGSPASSAAFVLVVNCLNFGSGYFKHLVKDMSDSGYMTMAAGLVRYFDLHWPFPPSHLTSLEATAVLGILSQAPPYGTELFEFAGSLAAASAELGMHLTNNFSDRFEVFLASAAGEPEALIAELTKLKSYQDGYRWEGSDFWVLKKAQITVSDLALAVGYHKAQGRRLGDLDFGDIACLTAFADNSVPHVLATDQILIYREDLGDHIALGAELEYGCAAEIDIRAATIVAIDELAGVLSSVVKRKMSAAEADGLVWMKKHRLQDRARYRRSLSHKTRSLYY